MHKNTGPKVCITGASGYLGSQILYKMVRDYCKEEYQVKATVRDLNSTETMDPIKDFLKDEYDNVEFCQVDITNQEQVDSAIAGWNYVIHTASPYPDKNPEEEDEIIRTAVNGTVNVIEACKKAKVRRLVITSDLNTIIDFNSYTENKVYDEEDYCTTDSKLRVL
jgi:nucleoside-diphosphate-sugar epimerase